MSAPYTVREVELRYAGRGHTAKSDPLGDPASVAREVRRLVGDDPREHVVVLYLDTRSRREGAWLVAIQDVSTGILNQALVHPREVFRGALLAGAASIVLAHNHPSGDPSPSPADLALTQRLIEAGHLLGIAVLDHVIVSERSYYSLRAHARVDFGGAS